MQGVEVSKRRRRAQVSQVDPAVGPEDADVSTGSWQGWNDDVFWQTLFNPLPSVPLPNLPEGDRAQQPAASKRRQDQLSSEVDGTASRWLNQIFPGLEPSAALLADRVWAIEIPNPFLAEVVMRHPRTRKERTVFQIPLDGCINGLIKIRLNTTKNPHQPAARLQRFPWAKSKIDSLGREDGPAENPIAYLPPDFGKAKLAPQDEKLFEFFRIAICSAVTLIPAENCYLKEVLPIATRSDCVKHAVLALAATYIMDYAIQEKVEMRANFHWKRAVHLLTRELNNKETCQPGKEDAVLAAMAIFSHNEVVNWELEQPREEHPTWFRATHLAEQVLAKSDPLYRYHFPINVQCSRARVQLGNKIALYNIMSATAWPLELEGEACPFTWLLEGSERDRRKVVGCTGCSPHLMHTYVQITHLSAKLLKDPNRLAAQKMGSVITTRLENFWQWSDLSEGHASSQDLIDSCNLDENGKVFSPVKVTELIAETYVAAAQIYLFCRLLRKPRNHPKIQKVLERLLWCIDAMPASGPLFTAQSAQLRVFIAAVVACKAEHRTLIRNWFEELVDGTRGNVPPVWRAVQFMWEWLDIRFAGRESQGVEHASEMELLVDADPWWEDLVAELYAREGRLNLA